jgi:hypothetical protein
MKNLSLLTASASLLWALTVQADLITSIPGPDDQGGMKMPMVTITGADDNSNPTTGHISISFNPGATPILSTLEEWSPGSWFADSAGWRQDLGSPAGVGGTPGANAGSGDLFNNQYGFMFMADPMMGTAYVPSGKSLAIRLTAVSSPLLESFNYVNSQNRWDPVFTSLGSKVLWSGSMWHNYFTLPSGAPAGTYSATFEVFIANQAFVSGSGFADYSASALAAAQDPGFTPASVIYTWTAVPEVSSLGLVAFGSLVLVAATRFRKPFRANA